MDRLRRLTGWIEPAGLLLVILIAGALWAFGAIAAEMLEGDFHRFDTAILLAFRVPGDTHEAIGGPALTTMMRDITALGGVTVLSFLTLAIAVSFLLRSRPASAAVLLVSVFGGQVLAHLAKAGFDRPRPDLVPHGVDVTSSSFPSGHSMMSAVVYLTLGMMLAASDPRLRLKVFYLTLAVVLMVSVGISRVFLGVHWPSDVLGGWMAGGAWALMVHLVARTIGVNRQIEPPADLEEGTGAAPAR